MAKKSNSNSDKITQVFSDRTMMTKILKSSINAALRKHKQAGNPVCESRNGKVVWIQPEDIQIPDDD